MVSRGTPRSGCRDDDVDIVLALAFCFGLVYAMVAATRWAFKQDREARKASGRKRKAKPKRARFSHPDLTDLDDLTKRAFGIFDKRDDPK